MSKVNVNRDLLHKTTIECVITHTKRFRATPKHIEWSRTGLNGKKVILHAYGATPEAAKSALARKISAMWNIYCVVK